MAPKLLTALLALAASAAGVTAKYVKEPLAAPQVLNVVYSSGSFSGLRGSNAYSTGFTLIDGDGNIVWEEGYPGGYSTCGNDRTFTLSGGCFKKPRAFHCDADFGGNPEHCGVSDVWGGLFVEADGEKETEIIGIATSISGACVFQLTLNPGEHCDPGQTDMVAEHTN